MDLGGIVVRSSILIRTFIVGDMAKLNIAKQIPPAKSRRNSSRALVDFEVAILS